MARQPKCTTRVCMRRLNKAVPFCVLICLAVGPFHSGNSLGSGIKPSSPIQRIGSLTGNSTLTNGLVMFLPLNDNNLGTGGPGAIHDVVGKPFCDTWAA